MVLVKEQVRSFNEFTPEPARDPAEPTFFETLDAAFSVENDVVNFLDATSRPVFKPDDSFKLRESLQQYDVDNNTSLFEDYSNAFIGTRSQDEMLYTIRRIEEETKQRDIISRAGWAGYASSIVAGLASPMTFVPLVGAGTKGAQIAKMASIGFMTGATSELVLQENQATRSTTETVLGIAASTALAGILGGVLRVMSPAEKVAAEEVLTKAAADINYAGKPRSAGAAVNEDVSWADTDAGGLAPGAQRLSSVIDRSVVMTNPVTQNINQVDQPVWRQLTQQLTDAGLRMERNIDGVSASPGGTLENRTQSIYGGILNTGVEKFDEIYAKYFYEGTPPKFARNLRSEIGGALSSTKLSKPQFGDEVTKAIWNGYNHQVPEVVEAAKMVAQQIFEPILKRAQEAKLLGPEIEVVGDKAYVHRMYNTTAIQSKTAQFVNILAKHEEARLTYQFKQDLEKLTEKQTKATEAAEDIQRPGDEAEALIKQYREQLDQVNADLPEDVAVTEELAREIRANAREISDPRARKQMLADARDMEKNLGGKELQDAKVARANIRRRLRNLTQTRALLDAKRARKLEQIERIDEQNVSALNRLVKKAQTTLRSLDKISDEKLDSELEKLWRGFAGASERFDKALGKVEQLETEFETGRVAEYTSEAELIEAAKRADRVESRIPGARDRFARADEKLANAASKIEAAENFDRATARQAIQDGLDALVEKVNEVNSRRAVRRQRLVEEQAKLKPENYAAKLREMEAVSPRLAGEFASRWGERGAMNVDLKKGEALFKDEALKRAEQVKDKIVGTYLRLPAMELLGQERSAELARVLDIPSKEIEEFLETDISKIVKTYVREMGPDIELYSKFGSMDWQTIIKPAVDDLNAKVQEIEASDLSPAQKEKQTKELNDNFARYKRNFEAMIERLRGVRGMPSEPDGFAYRAARTAMNLNVMRMMGMVTISSLPDLAQPVLKYGLTRTFRDGFGPLVNNLKAFKLNAREAKLANAANEITAHTRAMAVRDVVDDMQRGSRFEKGVEYLTNKMGLVALFDYWTQGMKMFTSSVANAKIMDALATLHGAGGNMTEKEATAYLAELNISGDWAQRIWKEVAENGGGGKVDGVWWPQTEAWKDQATIDAYRQALYREVSRTIIQPGLERPLLSDVNTVGRMLYQFKSFGMASTPKVVLAGLQQKDAAVLSGSLASLGMGALGYYLWAVASGGKAYEDMQNADLDKWADEAIGRSGLIGGLGEVQRVAQNIPLLSDFASFSGTKSTRRPGDSLVEALLGPSFDMGQGLSRVFGGIHAPTQSTLHEFRKLVPFQNTLFIREAIDAVEAAVGSTLPKRRSQ